MIRIFETGDLHIGRTYSDRSKHPEGQSLAEKRVDAIAGMVDAANREACDLFVVTGDLFDKTYGIGKKRVARVADELSRFRGTALILPGNHDHYPADAIPEVWQLFLEAKEGKSNLILLSDFAPYKLSVGDEEAVIYPAFCHINTAAENNLGWIKELEIPADEVYRIGIAHGAVAGHTIDTEGEYFSMTEAELQAIPMDLWLIGHTHVMFPDDLGFAYQKAGKILNAGTHVQTDVRNNTEGNCFIIELEKTAEGQTDVRAKRYLSGNVFFKRLELHIKADDSGSSLRDAITKAVAGIAANTSVSLKLSGTVSREEYADRENIYEECLGGFFEHPHPADQELLELISPEFINSRFSELTFPARLLMKLAEDPKKAQMAYDLLTSEECQV